MRAHRLFALVGITAALAACTPATPAATATTVPTATIAPTLTAAPATAQPAERVPFEVTVNGLQIEGYCAGTRTPGQPVVILQSGTGGGAGHLQALGEPLTERTMVCAWGRPGAGGSTAPAELPRTIETVVAEMRAILTALELEPPYFPIGQSGGAAVVFMFAQAYADEVAGFVAINPNPPYTDWVTAAKAIGLPAYLLEGAKADYKGANPEQIDFRGNSAMLSDPLPASMPYAVMYDEDCGGNQPCDVDWEAALQERLTQVGAGGRWVWAKGAGHDIQVTQPQVVADTIDEIWNAAVAAP